MTSMDRFYFFFKSRPFGLRGPSLQLYTETVKQHKYSEIISYFEQIAPLWGPSVHCPKSIFLHQTSPRYIQEYSLIYLGNISLPKFLDISRSMSQICLGLVLDFFSVIYLGIVAQNLSQLLEISRTSLAFHIHALYKTQDKSQIYLGLVRHYMYIVHALYKTQDKSQIYLGVY